MTTESISQTPSPTKLDPAVFARLLEEGYALRAADIDVVYLSGYGFPARRGGPMMFADQTGLAKIAARSAEFHKEFGARWTPAPLLTRLAAEGKTFASLATEKSKAA